jgi:hypothetical protein
MAEVERWMNGPQPRKLVKLDVASATVIEKGDFVLLFQGNAIPPSLIGYIYSSATVARREGCMLFGGIARNSSPAGSTTQVQIDVSPESLYKLTQCSAHAASVADLYGICAVSNADGLWGLEDQKVEQDCSYPIAVLMESKAATGTDAYMSLVPSKLFYPIHSYTICYGVNDNTFVNQSYAG